ncbi:predicted protein [Aspergillus terreus NIH2624]|uniref:Uncharacterized protein n=1 Tax=Aspergillus terreus (strain NIH 2624 / FGSC A1156) TaxID=341663 RepID=Q0D0T7_ASPTN|nr:uncharacterized protein ATEG_00447 [Aspergillus terreus NIH2624]EAU39093.1 predicted protein [Aspergillus terreus NIH2624]
MVMEEDPAETARVHGMGTAQTRGPSSPSQNDPHVIHRRLAMADRATPFYTLNRAVETRDYGVATSPTCPQSETLPPGLLPSEYILLTLDPPSRGKAWAFLSGYCPNPSLKRTPTSHISWDKRQ